jgi:hydroxymethylbilane synthase
MKPRRRIRIGTRGSRLAMSQADIAVRALRDANPGLEVELVPIRTRGDELSAAHPSGSWVATDGQFTSELERWLASSEVDAAIHSLKDLPTVSDSRLGLAAILRRGDPRDCLLTWDDRPWMDLPPGASVGTSSPRRAAQLQAIRPDLAPVPIRGNVETRLERMRSGKPQAVLLALAGLDRLGVGAPVQARLSLDEMLPAPGQAAIAIQCRRDDPAWAEIAPADHADTRIATDAERALLRAIGGGCLAPLGVFGHVDDGRITIRAAFLDRAGVLRKASAAGRTQDALQVVDLVAGELLTRGAPVVQAPS